MKAWFFDGFRVIWCAVVCLLGVSLPALAGPLVNSGVYVSPSPASISQTVTMQNSILATSAVSNATVTLEIHRVTNSNTINSYPFFQAVLTGQNFALNENKHYSRSFVVPAGMVSGTYTYTILATNAAKTVTYLNARGTNSPFIFTINGVANAPLSRGVNIMDLVSGSNVLPGVYGTNYTKPNLAALQALKARGHNVVRMPFLWERIQPTLNGSLNTAYLGYLLQVLRDANTAGLKVIVDMHNYGRYTPTTTSARVAYPFGDPQGPAQADYVDAWKKIAAAIKADASAYAALHAYDIMNEPYNLVPFLGNYTNKVLISGFETSTEGWTTNQPSTVTLAQAARGGQGSLKVTAAAATGSGLVYRLSLSSATKQLLAANGQSLELKAFVPSTTPGTVKARLRIVDSSWVAHDSDILPITKGINFTMRFTPTTTWWTNNKGIMVDFIVDNSDGSAPLVFYIDEVSQGTNTGARSGAQVWEDYSQAVVAGIRSQGDGALIMVEGYDFSSAKNWPINHPAKWITDSMNNTMYHAHMYLDDNGSGKYEKTHAQELSLSQGQGYSSVGARGVARAKSFVDWTNAQNVRGFLGEFGWPNSATVGTSEGNAWDAAGEQVFSYVDATNLGVTMWGTGSWLSPTDNILNTYTLPPSNTFSPLSPALVLEQHLTN